MSHLNLPKRIHKIPDDCDAEKTLQRWKDAETIEHLNLKHQYLNRPRYDIVDGYVTLVKNDGAN